MSYVTVEQVRRKLAPGGVQDESTAAQMADDEIEEAIVDAQSEVDGHLVDRFTVPFEEDEVPELVVSITKAIAAYLATLTHSRNSALPENHPTWLAYTRASTLLERLGRGILDLDTSDGDSTVIPADPLVVNVSDDQLFDRTTVLGPLPTYLP